MVKRARSVVKDDKQVWGNPDAPQMIRSRKKPRGGTGPFLRREQLGEARHTNVYDAEAFQASEAGREKTNGIGSARLESFSGSDRKCAGTAIRAVRRFEKFPVGLAQLWLALLRVGSYVAFRIKSHLSQ